MDQLIYRYRLYTLIDITKTDVFSYTPQQEKQRNQQRNWETVIQCISLRAQPIELTAHESTLEDVANYSFGIQYSGEHRIWVCDFAIEHEGVFVAGVDKYGVLKEDFRTTPVILNLTETAKPDLPLFYPSGEFKNIYFISVPTV